MCHNKTTLISNNLSIMFYFVMCEVYLKERFKLSCGRDFKLYLYTNHLSHFFGFFIGYRNFNSNNSNDITRVYFI